MADGTAAATGMDGGSLDTEGRRHEWERGWKVVAVSLVAYVFGSAGIFFAFGLFLKPLSSEFHWSREAISGFTSISGVMFAGASPLVGRLADRFGVRRVILICAVLAAITYGSQSLLTRHLWHYYALAFLWGPVTAGTTALTFGKVISNWFDRSRGLALSILACGSGLGGVVIPPFAQSLISHYGWREAYFLLGLSMLTVGTIPVALILKDAPPTKITEITSSAGETSAVARVPRLQVFRSYTFLTLIAVVAIVGISYGGVLTHLIPMLTDRGITAAAAARLLSLLGGSAIAGHLLIGFCFDRFPAARVAALTLALSGLGIGVIAVAQSRVVLALATLLLGAALGADTDMLPYLVSRYFALKSYGEFLGYFFATGTLGLAGGALFMGRVFDVYHSYVVMTNIIAAASIVAATLVYLLPKTTEIAVPQGS
jgi:predicted MFS family arabinose efflux permease